MPTQIYANYAKICMRENFKFSAEFSFLKIPMLEMREDLLKFIQKACRIMEKYVKYVDIFCC